MNPVTANLVASNALNIVALSFLLRLLTQNVLLSPKRERAYRSCIVLTILVMAAEAACAILDTAGPSAAPFNALFNLIGFSASGALPYLLTAAYDEKSVRHLKVLLLPPAILCVLGLASIPFGWIFSVSPENVYARGTLFWIYPVVFSLGLVVLLWANFRQASRYSMQERVYLAFLYLIFFVGISLQVLTPTLHTSWHCVTLALMLYYIFLREIQFRYDMVTGLLNRTSFQKASQQALPSDTVIILFDLDDFKTINDTYGHQAGDDCLRSCAEILQKSLSAIGQCYRIGGDEFCLIGQASESSVQAALHQMIQQVKTLRQSEAILPNISYGCAYLNSGETFHSAFHRADFQMYQVKRQKSERIRHKSVEF